MSHMAALPANYGASPSYYDQQTTNTHAYQQAPPMHQQGHAPPSALHYGHLARPSAGPMPHQPQNIVGSNAHYSLVHHQQGNGQSQQSQGIAYGLSQMQLGTPSQSPYRGHPQGSPSAMQPQYQQQQQQALPHQRAPLQQQQMRPGFARELFPHEQLTSSSLQASPSPNPEEYSAHERNVRSITESPPPDQIASMLSSILSPEAGRTFQQGLRSSSQPQQQSTSHMTPQQLHQQQLYAHFNQPAPFIKQQQAQAPQYHQSPAASIQLSQHQAHSLSQSNNFARPSQSPSSSAQPSYYDQMQSSFGQFGQNAPHSQQAQQPHGSPYHQTQQQHAPQSSPQQSIPGMASIIDPQYYSQMADLKQRQQQLMELQRQQQQQARMQQLQQQQQMAAAGDYRHDQYAHPPPPLQSRAQSLPEYPQGVQQLGGFYDHQSQSQSTPTAGNNNGLIYSQVQSAQQNAQAQSQQHSSSYSLQSPPLPHSHYATFNQLQPQSQQQQQPHGSPSAAGAPPGFVKSAGDNSQTNSPPQPIKSASAGNASSATGNPQQLASKVPPPPFPRRSQSLGETGGGPAPAASHEAVSVSLVRGGGARADLSRFSAGPPNQDSRGFVARCCVEARRGRSNGPTSSVLSRPTRLQERRGSKDQQYIPLSNPFSGLQSSPELPESAHAMAQAYGGLHPQRPSPLMANSSPNASHHGTPCASPMRQPRARMPAPLLPPKQ